MANFNTAFSVSIFHPKSTSLIQKLILILIPYRGNMWVAVIITLFLGGFFFYFFALYHRHIENKDFSLIDTDSEESETEEPNKMKKFFKDRLKPVRSIIRKQWKKLNKKKEFFKKNKVACTKKKLMMSTFERRLTHIFSTDEKLFTRAYTYLKDSTIASYTLTACSCSCHCQKYQLAGPFACSPAGGGCTVY